MHNSGSYTVLHPGSNLRVISWNTNFGYKLNFHLYKNDGLNKSRDPGGLFAWLIDQLLAAEKDGETVYIIGHMPPGIDDALRDYSNYFNQITTRFDDIIKGMFWGHTHTVSHAHSLSLSYTHAQLRSTNKIKLTVNKDEFEITYSNPLKPSFDTAKLVSYVTPCITPRNSNPSFRVYTVDPETYGVIDYTHYYTEAAELPALTAGSTGPVWKKLYSAKETYGPLVTPSPADTDELTPAFWSNVTTAFENNETAFQAWFNRKRANAPGSKICNGTCMADEICQMRASREQDNCQVVQTGLQKRGMDGRSDVQDTVVGREEMAVEHGRVECGSRLANLFKHVQGM